MPSRSLSTLVDDPVPLTRIARYALYAIVVYGVGLLVATVVGDLLDIPRLLLIQGRLPFAHQYADGVRLLEDGIRTFALLVGVGVFLSQFEPGRRDR